jgi:glutamate synthase domain-containing protein 3
MIPRNDWTDDERFDEPVLEEASELFKTGTGHLVITKKARNTERAIGTRLSYHLMDRFGPEGFPNGSLTLELTGTAGQSFGAFLAKSLTLKLEGEANDYVGKGLSGGAITLRPPRQARFKPEENILCGNTCLYGATSGTLFVNGRAGERFAVRNSGADAVVEGVGDHGCEYMTGGRVLILGDVGLNFGAGMTGGTVYLWDPKKVFAQKMNPSEIIVFDADWNCSEGIAFKTLLEEHSCATDSPLAKRLLADWNEIKEQFVRVVPKEVLARQKAMSATAKTG